MVSSAAVVIAVGGGYGTLAEIALALRAGTPVLGIDTWSLIRPDRDADTGIVPMAGPSAAAAVAVGLAAGRP